MESNNSKVIKPQSKFNKKLIIKVSMILILLTLITFSIVGRD